MSQSEVEQRFLDFVDKQQRLIYKVCFMYANAENPLEDLYQEVILNLWKSFPQFRGESKPSTWTYRIAMNTCITFMRKASITPAKVPITPSIESLFTDESNREQIKELYALINRLGKLERALILLWLDERSYEEISEILDISPSNVGVRINRIKAKLKNMSNL